jgi:hypothetical protein
MSNAKTETVKKTVIAAATAPTIYVFLLITQNCVRHSRQRYGEKKMFRQVFAGAWTADRRTLSLQQLGHFLIICPEWCRLRYFDLDSVDEQGIQTLFVADLNYTVLLTTDSTCV